MARPTGGNLLLCGIGLGRPGDLTWGTMAALKTCAVVYAPSHRPEMIPLLSGLCPDVRPLPDAGRLGRGGGCRLPEIWREVRRELAAGRAVGYVTYGHPLLYASGTDIAARCARSGFPCEVVPCPSAVDHLMAWAWRRPGLFGDGFLVRNAAQVASAAGSLVPGVTTVVFMAHDLVGSRDFDTFCRRIRAAYPARHLILGVQCADGHAPEIVVSTRAARIESLSSRLTPAMSVVIPATGGRRLRPRRPAHRSAA